MIDIDKIYKPLMKKYFYVSEPGAVPFFPLEKVRELEQKYEQALDLLFRVADFRTIDDLLNQSFEALEFLEEESGMEWKELKELEK